MYMNASAVKQKGPDGGGGEGFAAEVLKYLAGAENRARKNVDISEEQSETWTVTNAASLGLAGPSRKGPFSRRR